MIVLEFKLKGTARQYRALDEAIRTTQFIRNKCVRLWQDTWGTTLYAAKTARALVMSNDVIAYEDLRVANMVQNRHLAKSISDAGWRTFRIWLEYLARVYGKVVVAVPPEYTTQECSRCGTQVKKTLSERTHICPKCGVVLGRDHNAALTILSRGVALLGEQLPQGMRKVTLGERGASAVHGRLGTVSPLAEPRIPRL